MAQYDRIRTLAFQLAPHRQQLLCTFYTLQVPPPWKSLVLELQRERNPGRRWEEHSAPIRSLNGLLRVLVPDLVAIEPRAWQDSPKTWLHALEPIPPPILYRIIQAWIHTAFSSLPETRRQRLLEQMSPGDLHWERQQINLASWTQEPNGTARTENPSAFYLLPEVLAARLCAPGVGCNLGTPHLVFRRAPVAPGQKGTELISWPPRTFMDHRKREWPYSVLLTLTVQTVPFQPYPVLYCDAGIRRWAGPPVRRLPRGNTSAYVQADAPWIDGLHASRSFIVAPLRWGKRTGPAEDAGGESADGWGMTWGNRLVEVLDQLCHPFAPLPNPATLVSDPLSALEGRSAVAIAYRNGMSPDHGVEDGLPPADRRRLAEWLQEQWQGNLVLTPAPERVKARGPAGARIARPPANPFFSKALTEEEPDPEAPEPAECRALLAGAVGTEVVFEIRYQTARVRDTLVAAARQMLGINEATAFPYQCPDSGLVIHLQIQELGALGDALHLGEGKPTGAKIRQALKGRLDEVAHALPNAEKPTVVLAELAPKLPTGDPKAALRKGFALRNRLSQFINTPDPQQLERNPEKCLTQLGLRARRCILDALRQLGVQRVQPTLSTPETTVRINTVGLWMLKTSAHSGPTRKAFYAPVLVRVDGSTGQVLATAGGNGGWRPYRELLLAVAREEVTGSPNQPAAVGSVSSLLQRDLLSQGDTLLLVHAQNLRSAWKWLTNSNLRIDRLSFVPAQGEPLENWPGLRLVRIRDGGGHETPEWYAEEDGRVGVPSGVYRMGPRIFASIQRKPKQWKLNTQLSKLDSWTDKEGRAHEAQPAAPVWNASILELAVVGLQPGDAADDWALFTDELRDTMIHHDEETLLPGPLYLASLIQEYVVPLDDPAAEEDSEEEE